MPSPRLRAWLALHSCYSWPEVWSHVCCVGVLSWRQRHDVATVAVLRREASGGQEGTRSNGQRPRAVMCMVQGTTYGLCPSLCPRRLSPRPGAIKWREEGLPPRSPQGMTRQRPRRCPTVRTPCQQSGPTALAVRPPGRQGTCGRGRGQPRSASWRQQRRPRRRLRPRRWPTTPRPSGSSLQQQPQRRSFTSASWQVGVACHAPSPVHAHHAALALPGCCLC